MKKNILTLFIVATFGISVAEYRMAVPMEVSQGGALPNGSISFTGVEPVIEEPTPAVDECISPIAGLSGWRVHKTTGLISVLWNGQTVSTSNPAGTTSILGNGITYTPDTSSTLSTPQYNFYGACRNIPSGFNGGTWISIAPVVSDWADSGSVYGCTWSPDPSQFLTNQSVLQTGEPCSQDQKKTTQAREQNNATFVIRNVGSPVISMQTIASSERPTRTVPGTEVPTEPETCSGVAYGTTSWKVDKTNNDNVYLIMWKGATLSANEPLGDVSTFNYNGVVYHRGAFINDLATGIIDDIVYAKVYQVCRVNY